MTFAEIYEEKPFLISGEENVLVGDVGENNLLEKVKERKEVAKVAVGIENFMKIFLNPNSIKTANRIFFAVVKDER